MPRALTLIAVVTLAACAQTLDVGGPCADYASGEAPCKQQIYFPTGLAVDPDGDVLYVVSSNADLRYSGGALTAIDLRLAECAFEFVRKGYPDPSQLSAACQKRKLLGDGAEFLYKSQLTPASACSKDADCPQGWRCPNGYCTTDGPTVHTHFGCLVSPVDRNLVECDETPFVIDAVKIGNFGGGVRVQVRPEGGIDFPVVDPSCPPGSSAIERRADRSCGAGGGPDGGVGDGGTFCCHGGCGTDVTTHGVLHSPACFNRRLWLPVRGDPSITYVNVNVKKDADGKTGGLTLSCFDSGNRSPGSQIDGCATQRISIRDFHAAPGVDPNVLIPLPPEPFGVTLDEGKHRDGRPYSHLLVAHLSGLVLPQADGRDIGGEVSLINSGAFFPTSIGDSGPHPTEQIVLDVQRNFFRPDGAGRHGTFALAPRNPGVSNSYWYLTSRTNPFIAEFIISEDDRILPGNPFTINGAALPSVGGGGDIREMVFARGGDRAYFIDNFPPSVFTLDTTISNDPLMPPAGVPRNFVVDSIAVCQGPSHLGLRKTSGGNRLYVVCFTSGQVMVLDPDSSVVVDTISVGLGANDIAFNFGDGMNATGLPPRAYVTNYGDMTISVIDLEPGSPTENRVIGRIGLTSQTVTM